MIKRPAAEEVAGQADRGEADRRRPEDGVAVETGTARAEGTAHGVDRAGPRGRAADAGAGCACLARPSPGGGTTGDRAAALPGHQGRDHLARLAVRQLADAAGSGERQGMAAGAVALHLDGRKPRLVRIGPVTAGAGQGGPIAAPAQGLGHARRAAAGRQVQIVGEGQAGRLARAAVEGHPGQTGGAGQGGAEIRMAGPGRRIGQVGVLQPVGQAGMALDAGLGGRQGRDRLGRTARDRVGDMFDVAAGAALLGQIEGAPDPGGGLAGDAGRRRCAPENPAARRVVPDERQRVRRAGLAHRGRRGGHHGGGLVAGVAGLAGGIGDRDEGFLVAGLAVVLEEGVRRGEGAGRPLLVRVDPGRQVAVERGQRPEQAEGDDAQPEGPCDATAPENPGLGYDAAGRNARGGVAFRRLGGGEVDQDAAAVAGRQGQDVIAEGQPRGAADVDVGPGDEPAVDTEGLASGRDDAHLSGTRQGQGGVVQADRQVGQTDLAVRAASDACDVGRKDLLADDFGPADAACHLAKDKGHRAITSR